MKEMIKRTRWILLALALPFVFASCEREDDINAIFRENTWYLTFIKDGDKERFTNKKYSINFVNDDFEVIMPNGTTINGNWSADGGDSHAFGCSNMRITGNFADDTIAERMYSILKNAKKYDGTTTWLQIIEDKNNYMQFYNW